ncbi:hypothetical protein BofuT4_uP097100.1 [Botrytis cinerea T4]|uniref:Uncharacterized protein n=1 Tax=Botryotinia fuckeliana (strain T4) TaxID=999810 RepID=G2YCV4_BOTF4|nr:hypothetical protein BofuT4_uP097100.1 [Botrytis cinerea T4]
MAARNRLFSGATPRRFQLRLPDAVLADGGCGGIAAGGFIAGGTAMGGRVFGAE